MAADLINNNSTLYEIPPEIRTIIVSYLKGPDYHSIVNSCMKFRQEERIDLKDVHLPPLLEHYKIEAVDSPEENIRKIIKKMLGSTDPMPMSSCLPLNDLFTTIEEIKLGRNALYIAYDTFDTFADLPDHLESFMNNGNFG